MNEIFIRKAQLEDLNIIQNLNNELFKLEKENYDSTLVQDWPLSEDGKQYFEDLIINHYVIVAIKDDKIVGYLAGSINEKGSYEEIQYGEINNMLVDNNFRGFGIGKLLIDKFKQYCKDNNINNLKVVASAKNIKAIEFYKNNGFNDFDITLTTEIH
ncbi:MAG: GNAT family N-acetyltransferase [Bacilli bacterium]|nr:GNAT family N-acetyltransferase [Bacilli bacterium]